MCIRDRVSTQSTGEMSLTAMAFLRLGVALSLLIGCCADNNTYKYAVYRKWFGPGCGANGTEPVLSCEPTDVCYQTCGGVTGACVSHKVQCVNDVISWIECDTVDCKYACSSTRDTASLGYSLGQCVDAPFGENGLTASYTWSCADSCANPAMRVCPGGWQLLLLAMAAMLSTRAC
eukprot:TRINITY_DN2645_c0_g1_i3.p1 TRINITY_DN2645_c0_g1~~TRINITY_DN2645_c0_g1_i3.p1  ORF type:complete len:176 (-),score=37.25 TRINITY_DN2645_c0_g1_i3:168-695(-)